MAVFRRYNQRLSADLLFTHDKILTMTTELFLEEFVCLLQSVDGPTLCSPPLCAKHYECDASRPVNARHLPVH